VTPVGFLETGVIYCDDNLRRLSQFPSECVDLIYLDPPFFSNRQYEVIWGDEAEVRSFEDRWEGGIHVYVEWMRERMMELHRILKPSGTVYLHCDQHASHYLKVMMDDIFGRSAFLDEVIWHYQTASGAPKKWLHRNHDTIFRYAARKASLVTWNHPLQPWPEATLRKWQTDDDGRIYHAQNKRDKRYYINPAGKLDDDVWEITLQTRSKERLGYPTQKPEELLMKLISAASDPGDIVLDPFCGCGTTLVAAQRLGRQWIGIDISPTAVELEKRRLLKIGATDVTLVGMPVSVADLHALKPLEFQNWVINRINGTHSPRKSGDMGIDGYSWLAHEPIQVKQSEHIGRNVVDNFETAIERDGTKKKGYIIAFSFGRGAHEEAARAKQATKVDIELVPVSALLVGSHPLTQQAGDIFGTPPLPTRDIKTLPTIEELVGDGLARAAEEPESYDSN
jgi:DNA modification methylase